MEIVNFGSLNLDYVYSVEHFVRPGETIRPQQFNRYLGGKGFNQSVAMAKAGARLFHAGKIGEDGKVLKEQLEALGVGTEFVRLCNAVTGQAIIQVDQSGQNCIILSSGANAEISGEFIDEVLSRFQQGDLLLLQNEISGIACLIESAHKKGMKIAFNPSPVTEDVFHLPLKDIGFYILNEIEGFELTGEREPDKIADALLQRSPGCAVVLTLGRKGVFYRDPVITLTHGIYKVDRVDTTGAGDTFTGYFIAGLQDGIPPEENLCRASVASALSVSRKGASSSIPSLKEVLESKLEEA